MFRPSHRARSARRLKRPGTFGPTTPSHLWNWVYRFTGVKIPIQRGMCRPHRPVRSVRTAVPRASLAGTLAWATRQRQELSLGHRNPSDEPLQPPPRHADPGGLVVTIGADLRGAPRGDPRSVEDEFGSDADTLARLLKSEAFYHNGSNVSLLAASPTSVRGPHVPSLKLDEVDEIEPDIRESAMGMAMEKRGCRSSVLMTSTWHRVAGPMAELMDRGRDGAFPVDTFCIFEALETCPDGTERTPIYEKCPECPLVGWCHSDRDSDPAGLPKAKRSNGHYTIDSLIQKVKAVSRRVFESDYLCLRPKAAGVWFTDVRRGSACQARRGIRPVVARSTWRSIPASTPGRSGSRSGHGSTGRAQGQCIRRLFRGGAYRRRRTLRRSAERTRETVRHRNGPAASLDGPGRQRSHSRRPHGPRRVRAGGVAGRNGLESWPAGKKGRRAPARRGPAPIGRCEPSTSRSILVAGRLITAFQCYARARRSGQWMDYALDPQHPHEDLIDPLAGGLKLEFPAGPSAAAGDSELFPLRGFTDAIFLVRPGPLPARDRALDSARDAAGRVDLGRPRTDVSTEDGSKRRQTIVRWVKSHEPPRHAIHPLHLLTADETKHGHRHLQTLYLAKPGSASALNRRRRNVGAEACDRGWCRETTDLDGQVDRSGAGMSTGSRTRSAGAG